MIAKRIVVVAVVVGVAGSALAQELPSTGALLAEARANAHRIPTPASTAVPARRAGGAAGADATEPAIPDSLALAKREDVCADSRLREAETLLKRRLLRSSFQERYAKESFEAADLLSAEAGGSMRHRMEAASLVVMGGGLLSEALWMPLALTGLAGWYRSLEAGGGSAYRFPDQVRDERPLDPTRAAPSEILSRVRARLAALEGIEAALDKARRDAEERLPEAGPVLRDGLFGRVGAKYAATFRDAAADRYKEAHLARVLTHAMTADLRGFCSTPPRH